jgi:hypothetical protein
LESQSQPQIYNPYQLSPQALVIEKFFKIVSKGGHTVDFNLNYPQVLYDKTKTERDIILKARQEGFSSYVLGDFTVDCVTFNNLRAVVISHDAESTQRLLAKVHFYIENMKGLQVKTRYSTKNEIVFLNTGSTFYIGTAGARKFGRGDTIHRLHGSEVAFWDNPEELTAGLFQAVPRDGRIVLESTANGVGNFFHRQVQNSLKNMGRFKLHFFPWNIFNEYELQPLETFQLTDQEALLVRDFGLTPGQILWMREKLVEFERPELFKQEYPLTIEEAFLSSGWSFFPEAKIFPREPVEKVGNWVVWEQPIPGEEYAFGVDSSAGVGRDDASIEICRASTYEQVAEFVDDRTSPDKLALEGIEWGERYNFALAVIEANSYGLEVLNKFKTHYPSHRIYQRRRSERSQMAELQYDTFGWISSERSKQLLCADLRRATRENFAIHSEYAYDELKTFIEDDNKKLRAQEKCKDDCVIALGLAIQGLKYLPSFRPAQPEAPVNKGITLDKMRKYIKTLKRPGQAMMDGDYYLWMN